MTDEVQRGQRVGVEVKASSTIVASDFGPMRRLAEACGEKFTIGL
jgi:hypothetical protein